MVGRNTPTDGNQENEITNVRTDFTLEEEGHIQQLAKDIRSTGSGNEAQGQGQHTTQHQGQEQQALQQCQGQRREQRQEHQNRDFTRRRGGGSVVDDHHSPFSGGSHQQHGASSSLGQDFAHRKGGGSVVDDHRSPFSGGSHQQQGDSSSRGQDFAHRKGGASVVDDHRSPFSGGSYPQHGDSSSRGHKRSSSRRHRNGHDRHGRDWSERNRQNPTSMRGRDDEFARHQHDRGHDRHRQGRQQSEHSSSDSSSGDSSVSSNDGDGRYHNGQHPRKRRGLDIETGHVNLQKKAMSYRTAPQEQQKHIVERIAVIVKGPIFRKMKIITSEKMFEDAMKILVQAEDPDDEDDFVRIYKTCLVGGINSKRSTCEQAGQRIVRKLLIQKGYTTDVDLDPPYPLEALVKLRQGTTVEEKEAFLWFIGDFLASVVGTKVWGRKKYYNRVSEAVIDKGSHDLVVTVSDEAFAILIYENYIDKWIAKFHMERKGEKTAALIKSKYTSSVNDQCLYGGWSTDGIARFNNLCALVKKDRLTEGAKKAEDAVLLALRRGKFGENIDNDNTNDPQEERRRRAIPVAIEAFCEL